MNTERQPLAEYLRIHQKPPELGAIHVFYAGAPGTGKHVVEVIEITATEVVLDTVENTMRELDPSEVE